jgi:hypothetical protein
MLLLKKPARRLFGAFDQWNSVLEGKEKEKGGKVSKKFLRPWKSKGGGVNHTLRGFRVAQLTQLEALAHLVFFFFW